MGAKTVTGPEIRRWLKSPARARVVMIGVFLFILGLLAVELFDFLARNGNRAEFEVKQVGLYERKDMGGHPFRGMSWSGGKLALSDPFHKRILVNSGNGEDRMVIGGNKYSPSLRGIAGLTFTHEGNIAVIDPGKALLRVFGADGRPLQSLDLGRKGLHSPSGITWDGAAYVVTDAKSCKVARIAPNGAVLSSWGGRGSKPGLFDDPRGIAMGPGGDYYVLDRGNSRVQCLAPDGQIAYVFQTPPFPEAVAYDPTRSILFVSSRNENWTAAYSPVGRSLGVLKIQGEGKGVPGADSLCALPDGTLAATVGDRILVYDPQ